MEIRQVFQEEMRGIINVNFINLMFEEAKQLCCGFYHPDATTGYSRGGSSKSYGRNRPSARRAFNLHTILFFKRQHHFTEIFIILKNGMSRFRVAHR